MAPEGRTHKMRLSILSRKFHRWGAIAIGLPLLLVIGSGLLLQVKKQVTWVQPHEHRTEVAVPAMGWDVILAAAKAVPQAGVQGWEDIDRLDVRPGKGILKIITTNRWEVQMHLGTGEVLLVESRRSDLLAALHDGSFFGDPAKLWIFLPSGVVLFVLWLTGLYLWMLPYLTKRKRARLARQQS
jgi:uncharacterized iron-regulated membrane protein